MLESSLPDDPYLADAHLEYFPRAIVERFGHVLAEPSAAPGAARHHVTNDVVNSMGMTFVPADGGRDRGRAGDVARAFLVARDVSARPLPLGRRRDARRRARRRTSRPR